MLFDNGVNSQLEAYILGFIYADGHVKADGRTLEFNIGIKDIDFVQQMCDIFNEDLNKNYTVKIRHKLPRDLCHLSIHSTKLVSNLNKLYIHHIKMNDKCSDVFDTLDDAYKPAFLRGYFDGDGCITFDNGYPYVMFTSTNIVLLESIAAYCVNNNICSNSHIIMRDTGVNQFTIYGYNNAIKFRNLIYNDMNICLPRKYIRLMSIVALPPQASKYKHITYDKSSNMWVLRITINGFRTWFGRHKTEYDALNKYNEIANLHGFDTQIYSGETGVI